MSPDTFEHKKSQLSQLKHSLAFESYFKPLNLEEQRTEFFNKTTKNPQIQYLEVPIEKVKKIQEQLMQFEFYQSSLQQYIWERRRAEMIDQCKVLLSRDTSEFSAACNKLCEARFAQETHEQAVRDSSVDLAFEPLESLDAVQTSKKLREYLMSEYAVNDWDIQPSDEGDFYVRVQPSRKKVLVNKAINWNFTDFETLVAHEVDGHIVRYLNAQKQTISELRSPLPYYIKTEEGLATFLGDYCTPNGAVALKHHALKYLAGLEAMKSSFFDVFSFFIDHGFPPSLAFQRTFRLKRGVSDTSQAGCFAKEAVYYEGIQEVKQFIDAGGDIFHLFSGKLGIQDLNHVPSLSKESVIMPKRLAGYRAKNTQKSTL